MIAKLSGLVDATGDGWAVVDVGGVGYLVFCSSRTLSRLTIGEAVRLLVETHVREDAILLYGFAETAEREWFRMLTTVQGVGAKAALAVLSALAADELVRAIAADDRAAITRAAGVGPRLASRIIGELRERAAATAIGPAAAPSSVPIMEGGVGDAVSALVNLGFRPAEAMNVVAEVAGRLGSEANTESLVRLGLAELGARETAR